MDLSIKGASCFQKLLCMEQPVQMAVHGEVGELPLDDPCKPNQGTHIEEANGTEALLAPKNFESSLTEHSGCDA